MKNPEIIAELKRIQEENNGTLLPEKVVEAAAIETSPLHSQFEWDDSIAAHQHRLWQARMLIRVSVEFNEQAKVETRVFVSLKSDRQDGLGYRSLVDVMSDEVRRNELLQDAAEEMRSFRAKYKELKELADVFSAMEAVEVNIRSVAATQEAMA